MAMNISRDSWTFLGISCSQSGILFHLGGIDIDIEPTLASRVINAAERLYFTCDDSEARYN